MRDLWCRIRLDADFTKRQNYQFWVKNGHGGGWESTYKDFNHLKNVNILDTQAQGAVIKCPELAPEGKPYMWFGVNKFMASHLYVGVAPRPEGPWEVEDGGELPKDPQHEGPRYALYPHDRSCDTSNGVMLCSWSDGGQMGGKVVMAKFHFEKEDNSPPEAKEHYELVPRKEHGGGGGGDGHGHIGGQLKKGLKGLFG